MLTHPLDAESELRLLQPHHAQALYDLADRDRPHLGEWLTWVEHAQDAAFIGRFIRGRLEALAAGQGVSLSIWHRGQAAGTLGLFDLDASARKAEVGYWLGSQFQGKGLMTRSVGALLDYAFGELALRRVQIKVHPQNLRSRAVPERLGFRLEGLLRNDGTLRGEPCDHALYALTDRDWLDRV